MTTSHKNGKQRDRVASYAGGMLNRSNSGGGTSSSIQVNQKKKSYRARGCRGGASRKSSRKKQIADEENEENDPTLLNSHIMHDAATKQTISIDDSEKRRSKRQVDSENKMRTLSILPKEEVKQMDHSVNNIAGSKSSLPNVLHDTTNHTTTTIKSTSNVQSVIGRPSASTTSKSDAGHTSGGFSFFCISPRSFLSGKRKAKSPRLR